MRPRAPWMTAPDDPILEFFEEKDIEAPPLVVYRNLVVRYSVLDITYNHLKRRMRMLVDQGLLQKIDDTRGHYELSKKGQKYLSGELDASELDGEDSG